MRKPLAAGLIAILIALGAPVPATAAAQQSGSLSGVAHDTNLNPLTNSGVRPRSLTTNQVVATSKTDAKGAFLFTGVPPDNYVVELSTPAER